MSGTAPNQNSFKFKIAPHKQKSMVKKNLAGRSPPGQWSPVLNTPKHNGKPGTVGDTWINTLVIEFTKAVYMVYVVAR